MALRTKYADPDFRRDPKTSVFCAICQRDLKPGQKRRIIHCIDGGLTVIHPDDEALYTPDGGDMGCWPIGMDCARKLGLEWSRPAEVLP
ncbi:hypothetical protein RFM23_05355 [Mesorhizobium abyssinicae]|uniref:Uncharacterized protein n=1 Tax=Mesorhizobium abyssinicae TaxID=1209958 RepID=A0ABU5AID6_9HYPH|nr:hypothetical protein [Mesorhizobium abyssinicae]MDX8537049.1 hypothetical protein [Mesorhizobium abyssinicae]